MMHQWLSRLWYERHFLRWVLYPFSLLFQGVAHCRRYYLKRFRRVSLPVPVIVVGNITVGGVGKTPLVIAIAKALKKKGVRVGIISRGYGARIRHFPYEVSPQHDALDVGDEPLLLVKKTACPVVISPNRVAAAEHLLAHHSIDVIISDDGLQHYALARAVEIAVIDGLRGMGNGLCLPAGPLREPVKRLQTVDLMVVNEGQWSGAYPMKMMTKPFRHVNSGEEVSAEALVRPIAAIAGIGHPERFFKTLAALGLVFKGYSFADHHRFSADDLNVAEKTIVITEKDEVKCQAFNHEGLYVLPIEAVLDEAFWRAFWAHPSLQGFV